jgi:hypothetical protein
MAYIALQNFNRGLDSRRSELTSAPGTLSQCENAHITVGGEVEKRKAFVAQRFTDSSTKLTMTVGSTTVDTSTTVANYYKVSWSFAELALNYVTVGATTQLTFVDAFSYDYVAGDHIWIDGFTGSYAAINGLHYVTACDGYTVTIDYNSLALTSGSASGYISLPFTRLDGFRSTALGRQMFTSDYLHHGVVVAVTDQIGASGYYKTAVLYSADPFWGTATFTAGTTLYGELFIGGLQATDSGLTVFTNSGTTITNTSVIKQTLTNPINSNWKLYDIVTSCNFGGKAWVVAKFFDSTTASYPDVFDSISYVFYDGVALGEWWEGYLITTANYLSRMKDIIEAIPGFTTANYLASTTATSGLLVSNRTYKITNYVSGDDFTNIGGTNTTGTVFTASGTTPTTWTHSSTLVSEGYFDVYADYGLAFSVVTSVVSGTTTGYTATKIAGSVEPTPGYGAAAQFKMTGGTCDTQITITGFTKGATTVYLAAGHQYIVGDWVYVSGFTGANTALNGLKLITAISAGVSFTIAYDSSALTSASTTGTSAIRPAGLLSLQVVTPSATYSLFNNNSGTTPLAMLTNTGDDASNAENFAAYVVATINAYAASTANGYTAKNNKNQIAIYADPALGVDGNKATLAVTTINDCCTDTVAVLFDDTTASANCGPITLTKYDGTTVDLLNGTTVSSTNSGSSMAKAVAAEIAKHRATTGYTAAYVQLVDTSTGAVVVTHNVVISSVVRNSNDPQPKKITVTSAGSTAVIQGGYVGNGVFPTAVIVTVDDFNYTADKGSRITVTPKHAGGQPAYAFYNISIDTSGLYTKLVGGTYVQTITGFTYYVTNGKDGYTLTLIPPFPSSTGGTTQIQGTLFGVVKYSVTSKDSVGQLGTSNTGTITYK